MKTQIEGFNNFRVKPVNGYFGVISFLDFFRLHSRYSIALTSAKSEIIIGVAYTAFQKKIVALEQRSNDKR